MIDDDLELGESPGEIEHRLGLIGIHHELEMEARLAHEPREHLPGVGLIDRAHDWPAGLVRVPST